MASAPCLLHALPSLKLHSSFPSSDLGSCLMLQKNCWKNMGFYVSCRSNRSTTSLEELREQQALQSLKDEWIQQNDSLLRSSPLWIGLFSFAAVLLNRIVSGVAPVADASSAQSRADVLVLFLSATVVMTGLVWRSIKPKEFAAVSLDGIECFRLEANLPPYAKKELSWVWMALTKATCTEAIVVAYNNSCTFQVGKATESTEFLGDAMKVDAVTLLGGSLCQDVQASGKQAYLANLALYPARFQLSFLPSNTQAVVVQPLGDKGVMIVAGNKIRGYSPIDQVWITAIGEKLETTLEKCTTSLML